MMPSMVIPFTLLILDLCQGTYWLKQLIEPTMNMVVISTQRSIRVKCIHSKKNNIFSDEDFWGDRPPIVLLQSKITKFKHNDERTYIITQPNATHIDTGYYGCVYHNVSITRRKYKDPVVSWFFIFVKTSAPNTFGVHAIKSKIIKISDGDNVFLPHIIYFPDMKIEMFEERTGEKLVMGKHFYCDHIFGCFLMTQTWKESGFYRCLISWDDQNIEIGYYLCLSPKPVVTLIGEFHPYELYENVEFECHVRGFPAPNITMTLRQDKYCPSENNSSLVVLPHTLQVRERSFFIVKARMEIFVAGILNCTACNSEGCNYDVRSIRTEDSYVDFRILTSKNKIIEGDNIDIICAVSYCIYTNNIMWKQNDENRTIVKNGKGKSIKFLTENTTAIYRAILNIRKVRKEDANSYTCIAETRKGTFETRRSNLSIYDSRPTAFIYSNLEKRDLSIDLDTERNKPISLMCYVDGLPKPNVTWYKDGLMLEENPQYQFFTETRGLRIKYFREEDSGKYSCTAQNRLNKIEDFINIVVKGVGYGNEVNSKWKGLHKEVIFVIPILFIIVVILVTYFAIKIRREKILRNELIELGLTNFEKGALECFDPDLTINDQAEFLPYDKKWEFPRERLKLGKQLGSGAFGVVMMAEAVGIVKDETVTTVAVKMVRRTTDPTYVRALTSELKIIAHLGKHLNVVNLLGACTKNILKRELLVIVEYCPFGNLCNYLFKHRADFINQVDPATGKFDPSIGSDVFTNTTSVNNDNRVKYATLSFSPNISTNSDAETMHCDTSNTTDSMGMSMSPDGYTLGNNLSHCQQGRRSNDHDNYREQTLKPICTQNLLSWAFQVARGMEYLSQKKVLHGDLAARNILLAEDNIVKICDFGLAKTMYKNYNYKKKDDVPLPIKWMAIESIRDRVFSTQSDIWSFGIVLWEFFTLSETPYPDIAVEKLYEKLIEGHRMEQPAYATSDVYKIMIQCWNAKPTLRPSFTQLIDSIGDLLEKSVKAHYISLNEPYMEMNRLNLKKKTDYVKMMSDADHAKLLLLAQIDLNSSNRESMSQPAYLSMSPANPRDESGHSPTTNLATSRFEFSSVMSDS